MLRKVVLIVISCLIFVLAGTAVYLLANFHEQLPTSSVFQKTWLPHD